MENTKLIAAVETYFTDLARVRASGGATGERSSYGPLANLLNSVGAALRPKVFCIAELADQGAGHPDFGLYAASQVQLGQPRKHQSPEHGVVEVKSSDEKLQASEVQEQVGRYWSLYRQVLVTNLREFVLIGKDTRGQQATLEAFRLAASDAEFERRLEKPRVFAREIGMRLGEYLRRAVTHRAALAEPKDLARLLASYARDGLARVEAAEDSLSLQAVRSALEEALGVRFEGDKGARFFHSTLVQTLFYGIFSAWVLWARAEEEESNDGTAFVHGNDIPFNWRTAVWHLRVPVLRALFQQISDPGRLKPLGLVEVLDWTSAALDRVDQSSFFSRFNEGEAVPYFYEPFLQAFDPELRKRMGVWYTPKEIVRYMVARVDRSLKDDLGIPDGLAADNVYVLDPCCGTGAYLAEVLRRIAANLEGQGLGALTGARVKQAALERVFGFEIMPAPFVVAHLQVGLTMKDLDAQLAADGTERAGIFLTNALTGWEPTQKEKQVVAFPEIAAERDRANQVKRDRPILVILGNPPYDGFAGVAVDEEDDLLDAYRTSKRVPIPDKRALHDPYVRFFRMAERRIAEKTGKGIVCFISNYSWLDGRSFAGMRERYLEVFDNVRIDNLHGDRIISEYAPDGQVSETIFAVSGKSPGIRLGTSIALLSRHKIKRPASTTCCVRYRDFHNAKADARRLALLNELDTRPINRGYSTLEPDVRLGLPFKPAAISANWFDWPALPDLLPVNFSGVNTNRDAFVIDVDSVLLKQRIREYFDVGLDNEVIRKRYPTAMGKRARFDPHAVRQTLIVRGGPDESGFIRHTYRPFDNRWLYWEADTKLLNEKRPEYRPHIFDGNVWLSAAPHLRKGETEAQACVTRNIASLHLIERGANMFPAWLLGDGLGADDNERRPNLSASAQRYLDQLGLGVEELFHHIIATLHDPAYRAANAGALRMEWPRIPLPGWPEDGDTEAAAKLLESATRGRELAALLDPETPVLGVTRAPLRPEVAATAVPSTATRRNMTGQDFCVTAGWGHFGRRDAVMPGQGRTFDRAFTADEFATMGDAVAVLGGSTFDIYLNERAFWRNVPTAVWNYKLGGYQVLKKWLSYREMSILDRPLRPEEVQHFTDTARRIAAILLMSMRK